MSTHSQELANATNVDAGTVYYPDDDGANLALDSFFGLQFTAQDCTVSVEISNDRTNWTPFSEVMEYLDSDGFAGWLGGSYTFAAGATTTIYAQGWFAFADWIRVMVVYPNATNDFAAYLTTRGGI